MVLNVSEVRPDGEKVVEVEHSGKLSGKLVPRQEHLILPVVYASRPESCLFSMHAF